MAPNTNEHERNHAPANPREADDVAIAAELEAALGLAFDESSPGRDDAQREALAPPVVEASAPAATGADDLRALTARTDATAERAGAMGDETRRRILQKTKAFLARLEQHAASLGASTTALYDELVRRQILPQWARTAESSASVAEQLGAALSGVTRAVESMLPASRRRDPQARFFIDWTRDGVARWDAEAAVVPVADLLRDCMEVDGGFAPATAAAVADHLVQELRSGIVRFPRLRVTAAGAERLEFQLVARGAPPTTAEGSAAGPAVEGTVRIGPALQEAELIHLSPPLSLAEDAFLSEVADWRVLETSGMRAAAEYDSGITYLEAQPPSGADLTPGVVGHLVTRVQERHGLTMDRAVETVQLVAAMRLRQAKEVGSSDAAAIWAELTHELGQLHVIGAIRRE